MVQDARPLLSVRVRKKAADYLSKGRRCVRLKRVGDTTSQMIVRSVVRYVVEIPFRARRGIGRISRVLLQHSEQIAKWHSFTCEMHVCSNSFAPRLTKYYEARLERDCSASKQLRADVLTGSTYPILTSRVNIDSIKAG